MSIDSTVVSHFTDRASRYNRSSKWVSDPDLGAMLVRLMAPKPTDSLLDVACGTGQVSTNFAGKVGHITGLDITPAMFEQADEILDNMVVSSAESMPFEDASFDLVIERQGIQFMNDAAAVREMVRVCKPGGQICVVQLCAVGPEDKDEYHEVLRLRNPARKNFYVRGDIEALLLEAGCTSVTTHEYVSVEDVDAWSDNGAIPEDNREGIRRVYRNASDTFRKLHAVQSEDGNRFFDNMLFVVGIGTR